MLGAAAIWCRRAEVVLCRAATSLQGYVSPAWGRSGGGGGSLLLLLPSSASSPLLAAAVEGEFPWVARVLALGTWEFYRRGTRVRGGPDAGERRGCDGLAGRTRGGISAPQRLSCVRGKGETRAARNRADRGGKRGRQQGSWQAGVVLRALSRCADNIHNNSNIQVDMHNNILIGLHPLHDS